MAPSSNAVIYIYSMMIHRTRNTPVGHFLSNSKLCNKNPNSNSSLRNRISELNVDIFIDKTSMVINDLLFYYLHLRLNKIFDTINDEPFTYISIIAIGNFFSYHQ